MLLQQEHLDHQCQGVSQLKTPPRPVRLVTVPKAPISTQTVALTSPN